MELSKKIPLEQLKGQRAGISLGLMTGGYRNVLWLLACRCVFNESPCTAELTHDLLEVCGISKPLPKTSPTFLWLLLFITQNLRVEHDPSLLGLLTKIK